jgi:hypothetical protein
VELQKYHESAVDSRTMYHVQGIELHMKQKFTECITKRHRSTAEYFYVVTQSAVESEEAERGFRTSNTAASHDVIDMDRTPPPVELQKYHESAVDWEDNVPCIRNRVTHETKFY